MYQNGMVPQFARNIVVSRKKKKKHAFSTVLMPV